MNLSKAQLRNIMADLRLDRSELPIKAIKAITNGRYQSAINILIKMVRSETAAKTVMHLSTDPRN